MVWRSAAVCHLAQSGTRRAGGPDRAGRHGCEPCSRVCSSACRARRLRTIVPTVLRAAGAGRRATWGLLLFGVACACQSRANVGPLAPVRSAGTARAPSAAAAAPALVPLPRDESLWAAAERSEPDVIRDLGAMVTIDSGTGDAEGLERMAAFVASRLEALGAEVQLSPVPPSAGKLVHATFSGRGKARVLLLAHLDTVFARGEAARRPFRTDARRAFGPGVADDKGGVAVVLAALRLLTARGSTSYATLDVLFDPDEEKGSLGSRALIGTLSAGADVVLSFEPPDGERVIVQTNGIALVHVEVTGHAAHAGEPEKGANAAVELAHQILELSHLGDPTAGTTVSFTLLDAGDRANIIPAHAHATADMRFSDSRELERVRRDAARCAAKPLVPGTHVEVSVEPHRPSFPDNPESERLARLAERVQLGLGRRVEAVRVRYGTDAAFAYHPGHATPVVLEGLGLVGQGFHSPNEWADLDSIAPRVYLTVRLLEALAR